MDQFNDRIYRVPNRQVNKFSRFEILNDDKIMNDKIAAVIDIKFVSKLGLSFRLLLLLFNFFSVIA